jgi:hypothetical protein
MIIERKSPFTGVIRRMDLPVTQEQLDAYYHRRLLAQDAFPQLDQDQREFIQTGITSDEWEETFKNA